MFKNHRLEVIKQIIEEKKYIEVSALSEILNVSEVTIRRDLNKLEEEGLVIRSFGGVSLKEAHADQKQQKISHSDINRDISNRDIPPKSACMIGQIALQHIEDRDFIYIGSGKETKQLAVCLSESEKSVTVATNDMEIAQILSINRHIDTILTAGMISPNSTALRGELLLYTLERLVIKKAFISVDGVSLERGFSSDSYDMQGIIRFFGYNMCKLYIMFQSDKANQNAPYLLSTSKLPVYLISDFDLPAEFSAYYADHNIPLFTALT